MNTRIKISILLVLFGSVSLFLTEKDNHLFRPEPEEFIAMYKPENFRLSPDQVASLLIREDSLTLYIDLRSGEEYLAFSLPGAVNIPLQKILEPEFRGYFEDKNSRRVLFSNGELISSEALALLMLEGSVNNFIMTGGLNQWFDEIMLSEFTGEKISPRENALFETRYKARRYFNEINSLPDSLKLKYIETQKASRKKLAGGCE